MKSTISLLFHACLVAMIAIGSARALFEVPGELSSAFSSTGG